MHMGNVVDALHENNEIIENAGRDAELAQGLVNDLKERGANFQGFVLGVLMDKMTNHQKVLLRDFIYSGVALPDDFLGRK